MLRRVHGKGMLQVYYKTTGILRMPKPEYVSVTLISEFDAGSGLQPSPGSGLGIGCYASLDRPDTEL